MLSARPTCQTLLTLCLLSLSFSSQVQAAEIRLKSVCQPAGSVLVLGDVADIFSTDANEAAELAALPLVPTPASGAKLFLRVREIQDLLVPRGVNLAVQRFSGANQVTVSPVADEVKEVSNSKPAIRRTSNQPPQQLVTAALTSYLEATAGDEQPWEFDFQLSAETQLTVRQAVGEVQVSGGSTPWTGIQQFTLHVPTAEGQLRLPINVQAHQQHAVVAVIRALPRGSIVRAEDVQLVEPASHDHVVRVNESFHSIESVVGKETQRAISPGQVLDANYVRNPILVRRGDVVTVYANSSGIRVRTTGRSLGEGSKGELITIETLETGKREKFDARVSGAQVVEVWAGSTSAR